jgi:hypothetical protein
VLRAADGAEEALDQRADRLAALDGGAVAEAELGVVGQERQESGHVLGIHRREQRRPPSLVRHPVLHAPLAGFRRREFATSTYAVGLGASG